MLLLLLLLMMMAMTMIKSRFSGERRGGEGEGEGLRWPAERSGSGEVGSLRGSLPRRSVLVDSARGAGRGGGGEDRQIRGVDIKKCLRSSTQINRNELMANR